MRPSRRKVRLVEDLYVPEGGGQGGKGVLRAKGSKSEEGHARSELMMMLSVRIQYVQVVNQQFHDSFTFCQNHRETTVVTCAVFIV